MTLAHEVGHAYHGMMIQDHKMLNTDYSMPVAETASTFNENIIMNAAIDEAEGETKLALIETQLQDLTQIMCDINSRFLLENKVFSIFATPEFCLIAPKLLFAALFANVEFLIFRLPS